jgi:two-component system sensor histidine kinase BarA
VHLIEANEHARLGLHHMLADWGMHIIEPENMATLQLSPTDKSLVVVGIAAAATLDEKLVRQLEALLHQEARLVIITSQVELLQKLLAPTSGHYQLLGKPATRLRLYDAMLEVCGAAAEYHESQAPQRHFEHVNALVVDDHLGNLRLAEVFLSEMGVQVHTCSSGTEAIEAFSQQPFDIVFMDIQMPGMDGIETTQRLRQLESHTNVPIVALTAHALASERQQLLSSGMDDYLTKPLNEKLLGHVLRRWTTNKISTKGTGTGINTSAPPSALVEPSHDANSSLPSLDPALALQRCAGKKDLVEDMHSRLFSQLAEESVELERLKETEDMAQLLEQVHRLHGATKYCGTPKLEHHAGALESLLKTGASNEDVDHALQQLLDEITALLNQDMLSIITNANA